MKTRTRTSKSATATSTATESAAMPTHRPKSATATSTRNEATMPTETSTSATTTVTNTEATMSTHPPIATVPQSLSPEATLPPLVSPKTGIGLVFLPPPPLDAKIPVPPSGAATPNGGNYRSFVPRATELAALPAAVDDLKRFTSFAQVFGVTGLQYTQVLQAFTVGNQWSTMRKETAAWDAFCATQEGIAWATIRALMDRMRPVFEIAAVGDQALASTFPSFAALFSAKKAIAQKAVATKRLNKAAVARGEAPIHGVVGKRRLKAANRAILAAAKAGGAASPSPSAPPPPAAPVPPAPAPVAAPQTAPAASNGVAHS